MPATQPPPITSLPLPTALGMFQVTGSFGTTDPDTGDWIPATGTVVAFDPTIDSIKVLGDDPMGLGLSTTTATLDDKGQLPPTALISPDSPGIRPNDWGYRVRFTGPSGAPSPFRRFTLPPALPGDVVNISETVTAAI